jgi:hypothetical protein
MSLFDKLVGRKDEEPSPSDSPEWRRWREHDLPKLAPYEKIARERCVAWGVDPDKSPFETEQLHWHAEATELLNLHERICALRRAGLLDEKPPP